MKIVIGLGNPGTRYMSTRHNLGSNVVSEFARLYGVSIKRSLWSPVDSGKGVVDGRKVLLVIPRTYMNLSGKAARAVLNRHKADISDMLVVCDDINLPIGRLRLKGKGSEGGHNGLRSIVDETGSSQFPRLRMGIAGEGLGKRPLDEYVLSGFDKGEIQPVEEMKERAIRAIKSWLCDGMELAMSGFNS